jgi:hypothetical protein
LKRLNEELDKKKVLISVSEANKESNFSINKEQINETLIEKIS